MFDHSFSRATISQQLKYKDFVKHRAILYGSSKTVVVDSAVEKARLGFDKNISLDKQLIGKRAVFTLSDLAEELVLRKASQNLSKLTNAKQSDRNQIVASLKLILEEDVPFRVYKIDIKSFYESVDVSRVLETLRLNVAVSRPTYKVTESFFRSINSLGVSGLPRGLSLSATLSEFVLHDFDETLKSLSNVFFYNRYVDDIVLITDSSQKPEAFISEISSLLPSGLQLNEAKTEITDFPYIKPSAAGSIPGRSFEYLGYRFTVLNSTKMQDERQLKIDIAENKVKKIKSRCALACLDFVKAKDFPLLEKRIKFLTSNHSIYDPDAEISRLAGIYYSYKEVLLKDSKGIRSLDVYLRTILLSRKTKISKKLRASLTRKQRKMLLRYTFSKGFGYKVVYSFCSRDLENILRCWKHV